MASYLIRRLLAMIPALLGIATITFLLMHLTPGGPFSSEHSDPLVRQAQLHAYHLDEPIWPTFIGPGADVWKTLLLVLAILTLGGGIFLSVRRLAAETPLPPALTGVGALLAVWYVLMVTQLPGTTSGTGFVPGQFLEYLGNLVRGDLGPSLSFRGQTVNDIIGQGASNSLLLGTAAFLILVALALPLGIIAALRQNTWVDYVATSLSLIGYSIPNFVLGVMLILVTASVIPIAQWTVFPRDLILPAVVLAIRPLAVLTRLTRASMVEVLNQDYIRTAWAKGLGARLVVTRHALRNAFLPVVTVMGDHLGDLITGSIVVETLFNVPGIGQWFVKSALARDYGMIMGTTLFYATLVLLINLAVDLLYAVIDPRIKLGAAARS
jgi:ABC-type dipeptide/oligopeptide/nickel transport system permease component